MEMKIHLLVLSLASLTLFHPTSAICVKRNASMQQFGPFIARPVAPPATQSVSLSTPQSSQPLQSDPAKSLEAQKNQQPQTQPSTPDQTPQTQQSTPSQAQPVQPPLAQQTTPSPAQPVQTPPTQQATPAPTQPAQPPPTQETTPVQPPPTQPVQPLLSQQNTPAPAKSDPPPLTQQVQPHHGLGQPAPLDSPDGPVPSTPTNQPAQPALSTPLDSPDGPVQPTPVDSPDGPVPANPVDSPDGTAPLDSPNGPAPVEGVALPNLPFLNIPGITIADPQPAEPSHGKESKGIQELCHKTDFPDVCISLIPPNTNPDPASALRALINVGKEKAKAAMDASKNMSVNSPPADMVTSTLEVCHESYGDTISDFDSALKALDAHDNGTLMTMLSGALTSTSTCSDSFAELPGVVSPVATHDDPITTLIRICLAFGDMMK